MKLIECVPNFSEGKDKGKIEEIAEAINSEAKLLNVESDTDHNRTVITLAGSPKEVLKAAYQGVVKVAEIIDMTKHKGAHPRIGAADIIPFIPLEGATMKDCTELANKLGKKVGKLGIPVYIYGEAAKKEERKLQSNIRKGQYEGLAEKMKLEEWKPDYGPTRFNPRSGATMIGARKILIAYNVYLSVPDLNLAKHIAKSIRESSGGFKAVQAGGMMVDGLGQVSMNLRDYETTGIHTVYDKIFELAKGKVKKSELIGIAPKQAFIDAGKYWYTEEKEESMLIEKAIEKLNFGNTFDPKKKIIEYMI
ncbi:MAG: glutamate formimidoyltransferase [Nanoarchaeota archaeon]|nr:glutamate formimidoyltransferase [Nanoarchaeota archaeon]